MCLFRHSQPTQTVTKMTQKKNTLIPVLGILAASTVTASAAGGAGDWADTLKGIGKVYSDKSNPIIQEVKFFGRAHAQWNYSDGESAGADFDGNGSELRRFRFGTSVKFLNGFKALGRINIEKGGFRDTSIGYDGFDELYLEYGAKNVLGFDSASIGYGRFKVAVGGEEHVSSKKIKTVERSNINNAFGGLRGTGVRVKAKNKDLSLTAGVFSTEGDRETWANWKGGTAFYGSATFKAAGGKITADFLHANDSRNGGDVFDFDWVSSVAYNRSFGNIDLLASATYADTGNENVYGVVIMPSTFLVPEKLEAVFRYQWAHSTSADGVPKSSGSRGIRRVARNEGVGTGAGNDNHTFYAGLNYYLVDHYAKIMVGAEYEKIDGDIGRDLDGFTLWSAFRAYF